MSTSAEARASSPQAQPDIQPYQDAPVLIIVMGVSGCGKSTLGAAIASALSLPFLDADDLHPPSNVQKMSDGTPLTDGDRAPWLVRVRGEAARAVEGRGRGVVIACSALKRSYRAVLRGESTAVAAAPDADEGEAHPAERAAGAPDEERPAEHTLRTYFVHPHGARDILLSHMTFRKAHFMKASMLDSQLATLEDPAHTGEANVVQVRLDLSPEEQRDYALENLRRLGVSL